MRAGLTRRVVDLLGLARRAGQAVGGFAKAREALARAGRLVVQARTAARTSAPLAVGARDVAVAALGGGGAGRGVRA